MSGASNFVFGVTDYIVFFAMLLLSTAIGVYFGFFAKGANTTDEYLLGGKKMKTVPIAISLVASQLSAISIMTIPSEMYAFGLQYIYMVMSIFIVLPVLIYVIIPVFHNNNISNCYEYLERRFDKKTRELVTVSFLIQIFLMLPIFIFIPALAFAQVSGINIHLINGIVCTICVFYTMIGGIKAVVWTDVVQGFIMVASVVIVGIIGVVKVGGFGVIFERALGGGRMTTDFSLDLTTRITFWNCFFAGLVGWVGHVGLNPSCVQRIVALPKLKNAKNSLIIFSVGLLVIMAFNCFTGLIMYAKYFDCDPIKSGSVSKPDKMMPYFVQDIVGNIGGMPGFFISCVFSAALSTMSASLNSLSGILYLGYIKPYINHTEFKANLIMRSLVVITGIYCILAGLVVEKFSSILQMMITITGVTAGAGTGTFLLGFLYPRAQGSTAFYSSLTSMAIMLCIILAGQYRFRSGDIVYNPLPTSIEGCNALNVTTIEEIFKGIANNTTPSTVLSPGTSNFSLLSMSFNWYSVFGAAFVWLTAIPLSYILPADKNKKLDSKLLSPFIQPFVSKSLPTVYEEVPLEEKPRLESLKN